MAMVSGLLLVFTAQMPPFAKPAASKHWRTSGQSNLTKMSHRRSHRRCICLPGGANVHDHLTHFLGPNRVHIPNGIWISSVVFAQLTAESRYTLHWAALSSLNCPLAWGSGPHLIHASFGPPEPTV